MKLLTEKLTNNLAIKMKLSSNMFGGFIFFLYICNSVIKHLLVMSNKKKITTINLQLHGFKQMADNKNIWIKWVPIRHSHDALKYTYHWKERILEYTCYDCVGFVEYTGQICNEHEAYKEIMTI